MRRSLTVPLALLFLVSVLPSDAQTAASSELVVAEGSPLSVRCALGVEQRAVWTRDEGPVPGDLVRTEEPAAAPPAGLVARLTAPAARTHHAGLYRCATTAPAVRVRVVPARTESVGEVTSAGAEELVTYDVRGPLRLNCSDMAAGGGGALVWTKNGTVLTERAEVKPHVSTAEGVLAIKRSTEDDWGNYTCAAAGGGATRAFRVHARTVAKLPPNTNVVEGQKLRIVCRLVGKPYSRVEWRYSNSSDELDNNTLDALAVLGSRAHVQPSEQGVEGAELVVEPAARTDAGRYTCRPEDPRAAPATTVLRVKDMYAALWPFLGICAEVFVLCAIILVYERRRTKPELDDSDTDNHDQKKS